MWRVIFIDYDILHEKYLPMMKKIASKHKNIFEYEDGIQEMRIILFRIKDIYDTNSEDFEKIFRKSINNMYSTEYKRQTAKKRQVKLTSLEVINQ